MNRQMLTCHVFLFLSPSLFASLSASLLACHCQAQFPSIGKTSLKISHLHTADFGIQTVGISNLYITDLDIQAVGISNL